MWIAALFVIAGIVLGNNPGWFAGAATVGAFCFWIGTIVLVLVAVLWIVALFVASGSRSRRPRGPRW